MPDQYGRHEGSFQIIRVMMPKTAYDFNHFLAENPVRVLLGTLAY